MSLNYETLIVQLNHYLTEKYPGITLHTDIFEHAFLYFLGYQFVPEKCQFDDNQADNSLSIFLRTSYEVVTSDFLSDLRICATGEFSDISVEEINPNLNQGRFCVQLKVPYSLIETYISRIFQSIDMILEDPFKMNFYCYWDIHTRNYNAGLTIIRLENLVREKLLKYPHLVFNDVWSAIIQKNTGKNAKVKYLEKQVSNDVNNFPKITLIYEENREKNEIVLTRDQIVATLENSSLDKFLISNTTLQEFIPPIGINEFIKEKYHRSFIVNNEGYYEIDLGYHHQERKILEKYGIKELSSYRPHVAGEQSRYYVYDKNTYQQLLIALKEIKGEICFDERWNQLTYYINNQMWEKLNKELKFLLNLKTEVEIDYIKLLLNLYQYAKNNLQGKFQENIFEIVEGACKHLVSKIPLQKNIQKEIYSMLFEFTLMRMNQLEASDEIFRISLKKDLFIFAQQAGLEESKHYLAEIAGLKFGDIFSSNVNDNPIAALVELAEKHKDISEENAHLKNEIAKLRTKVSLQENTINPNVSSVSHFTLRK